MHQWASNERTREFLRKEQGIERIPCYYRFLCLLKLVKPESLNRFLKQWAERLLLANRKTVSVALDGKTIRSTGKMGNYESSLHIVSVQLCEMGITLASRSIDGKSNEILAVQKLLKELDISGCMWRLTQRGRHLLRTIYDSLTGRNGPGCAVLARFIRNLRKRAGKPANGMIISPAGN